jgi:hypothetical protein
VSTARDGIISANEGMQCFGREAPRKMPFWRPMHQRNGAAEMSLEKDYSVFVVIMCYFAFAQIYVPQLK